MSNDPIAVAETEKSVVLTRKSRAVLSKYGIYIAFILLCVIMSIFAKGFFSVNNAMNILKQVSINGVLAIGVTFVILSGGIDLSSGSIVALTGVAGAILASTQEVPDALFQPIAGGYPILVVVLATLLIGVVCGLICGVVTARGNVPPFIATLGMMTFARGLALLLSKGGTVPYVTEDFKAIGGSYVFGVPVLAIIFCLLFVIASVILYFSRFGRHVYAVGGNEHAAHVSGVKTKRVKTAVYALAGFCSGLGGLLLASRISCGSPVSGEGFELDAIAACVIGGTSLVGGKGKLLGTLIGVLIIGVMSSGLDMLNVNSYYQKMLKGVIIVAAVLFDMRNKSNANKV